MEELKISAKNETLFPKAEPVEEDIGIMTFELYYEQELVDDWFKRCMEDFPRHPVIGRGDPWTHREYEAWFKKWFTQFRDKCRK